MEQLTDISYYQFYRELDYPIFIKFEDPSIESKLVSTIEVLGFNKIDNKVLKDIKIDKSTTRVLVVKEATHRVARQIVRPHKGLESFGQEDISPYGNYDVYRYINAAIMMMGHNEYFWEMAICNIDDKLNEIKVAFTRYLGLALSSLEIVGFWGKPLKNGFVVTKPKDSNYESFFIDCHKGVLLTSDGIFPLNKNLLITRTDETLNGPAYKMSKESLLSFLCHNTVYFSYLGLDFKVKRAVFEFVKYTHGQVAAKSILETRSSLQMA